MRMALAMLIVVSTFAGLSAQDSPKKNPKATGDPPQQPQEDNELKLGVTLTPRTMVMPVSFQWIYSDGEQLFVVLNKRVGNEFTNQEYVVRVPLKNADGTVTLRNETRVRRVPKTTRSLLKVTAGHHFRSLDGTPLDPAELAPKVPQKGQLVVLLHSYLEKAPPEWRMILKPDTIVMQVRPTRKPKP